MTSHKIIFIVTSCINFDTSPLSYFHTRSVFSPQERLEQTIVTLSKIREKIPNVTILLANNNSLTHEQESILRKHCDDIYILDDEIIRTHPNKSNSECKSLLNACKKIIENNLEFDYVFKTSGRYYLMDEFDINKWPFNESKIVSPRAGNGVVNNVIYSVHKNMFNYYMTILQNFIELSNDISNKICVEEHLFDFNNTNIHEFLQTPAYVAGMCSVQPRVMWSC